MKETLDEFMKKSKWLQVAKFHGLMTEREYEKQDKELKNKIREKFGFPPLEDLKAKLVLIDDPFVDAKGFIHFDAVCPDNEGYYEARIDIRDLKWEKMTE